MALLTVGIGDCRISRDPADSIVTHALGSCIAVAVYDPAALVAGLLHFMLPDSSIDSDKATRRPFMFADTGIPLLIEGALRLGATKLRLVVIAAGGAHMLGSDGIFDIGRRNLIAMRKAFWKEGITAHNEEIGGSLPRTLRMDVALGRVQIVFPDGRELEISVNSNRTWVRDGMQNIRR